MEPQVIENLELLAELELCETRVWEALVSGDQAADEQALHPDFLGVYPDGFTGKKDHVEQLANGPTIASYGLSNLNVMSLGPNHAVLSYRADFQREQKS